MITRDQAIAEWVAALRSGDYKQLNGSLKGEGNLRCCLGVACDIYSRHVGGEWKPINTRHGKDYSFFPGGRKTPDDCNLPHAVMRWFGFSLDAVRVTIESWDEGRSDTLATLNDDGLSFDQIADIIEAGLINASRSWRRHEAS